MCGMGQVPHIFSLGRLFFLLGLLIIACLANPYLLLQNAEVNACLFELLLLFSKIA